MKTACVTVLVKDVEPALGFYRDVLEAVPLHEERCAETGTRDAYCRLGQSVVHLMAPESGVYVNQLTCTLPADLDSRLFRQAGIQRCGRPQPTDDLPPSLVSWQIGVSLPRSSTRTHSS